MLQLGFALSNIYFMFSNSFYRGTYRIYLDLYGLNFISIFRIGRPFSTIELFKCFGEWLFLHLRNWSRTGNKINKDVSCVSAINFLKKMWAVNFLPAHGFSLPGLAWPHSCHGVRSLSTTGRYSPVVKTFNTPAWDILNVLLLTKQANSQPRFKLLEKLCLLWGNLKPQISRMWTHRRERCGLVNNHNKKVIESPLMEIFKEKNRPLFFLNISRSDAQK